MAPELMIALMVMENQTKMVHMAVSIPIVMVGRIVKTISLTSQANGLIWMRTVMEINTLDLKGMLVFVLLAIQQKIDLDVRIGMAMVIQTKGMRFH